MNSLISIIIPTFNRAHLIEETLDSILTQTYQNWECIIVDDGSIDDTENVINKYLRKDVRFQYYYRPKGRLKGPNSCRNYGFGKSKGEYIKWFDSDDILLKNALEENVNKLDENTDVVICSMEYVDFRLNKINKKHRLISNDLISDYFTGKIAYYISGPLWERGFLKKQTQLFDESLSNLDDWDFNLRMLYQKPAIKYVDIPLIQYRCHGDSLSREIEKLNFDEIQSEMNAREKHFLLIKENQMSDPVILRKFIRDRYKWVLREALVQKDKKHFYYFRNLIKNQYLINDWRGMFKSVFAYLIFKISNNGYKFLK